MSLIHSDCGGDVQPVMVWEDQMWECDKCGRYLHRYECEDPEDKEDD